MHKHRWSVVCGLICTTGPEDSRTASSAVRTSTISSSNTCFSLAICTISSARGDKAFLSSCAVPPLPSCSLSCVPAKSPPTLSGAGGRVGEPDALRAEMRSGASNFGKARPMADGTAGIGRTVGTRASGRHHRTQH